MAAHDCRPAQSHNTRWIAGAGIKVTILNDKILVGKWEQKLEIKLNAKFKIKRATNDERQWNKS